MQLINDFHILLDHLIDLCLLVALGVLLDHLLDSPVSQFRNVFFYGLEHVCSTVGHDTTI